MMAKTPNYGIDAPGLVRAFLIIGAVALIGLFALSRFTSGAYWALIGEVLAGGVAAYCLGMGAFMINWSLRTKVREREAILDLVDWRGDELVVDVGCGRGLMLVAAARRLETGQATGIDIWQATDQSANGPEGARTNAALEGVADRIAVETADMRSLPFEDASIDVVVSHWAVHNLADKRDRAIALAEMVRVLKPGGAVVLSDIENRDEYAANLAALGLTHQRLVVAPLRDAILKIISFGSFRPATLLATRVSAQVRG